VIYNHTFQKEEENVHRFSLSTSAQLEHYYSTGWAVEESVHGQPQAAKLAHLPR
jgi:hypothetical protein